MDINDFSIRPHEFLLKNPYMAGGAALSKREILILDLIGRKGCSGHGEAAPLPGVSEENLRKVGHQLKCLKNEWTGRSLPDDPATLCSRLAKDLDRSTLSPSVIFCVESAVISLAANEQGVSIAEFLGKNTPRAVSSACLIEGDLETVRACGAKYTAAGQSVFTLKVGGPNIPLDVQKVNALRDVINFTGKIRLDAAGAWNLEEALAFAFAIGKDNIDFLAEPCQDQNDYENFYRRSDLPWALEAHASRRPLDDWEGLQGLKAIIFKPMLAGGVTGFPAIIKAARNIGTQLIVTSVLESTIGLKTLANLAALTNEVCGLGAAEWSPDENSSLLGMNGIILPERLV